MALQEFFHNWCFTFSVSTFSFSSFSFDLCHFNSYGEVRFGLIFSPLGTFSTSWIWSSGSMIFSLGENSLLIFLQIKILACSPFLPLLPPKKYFFVLLTCSQGFSEQNFFSWVLHVQASQRQILYDISMLLSLLRIRPLMWSTFPPEVLVLFTTAAKVHLLCLWCVRVLDRGETQRSQTLNSPYQLSGPPPQRLAFGKGPRQWSLNI